MPDNEPDRLVPSERPPLRIGDAVPGFTARSTQGPVDLADFRGRWLILFSHPGDFTPVCTSEFVALARASDRFAAQDCALVGLSADSLYAHLAWLRMIHDMTGVSVDFPVIEDPTMAIARAFGMLGGDARDAGAMRVTCFIDPDGILRATTCYPANVGRSIPEMLRVLSALRTTQDGEALAPADWKEGDALLCAPQEMAGDVYAGKAASDWFYRALPKP